MPSGRTQIIHGHTQLTLGALASHAAKAGGTKLDGTTVQGFLIEKLYEYWGSSSKTAGEGPISVGWAVQQSETEIAEAMAADPQYVDDPGEGPVGNRPVYKTQVIPKGISTWQPNQEFPKMRLTGIRGHKLYEGLGLFCYAYNEDGAVLTTGVVLECVYIIIGRWLRD